MLWPYLQEKSYSPGAVNKLRTRWANPGQAPPGGIGEGNLAMKRMWSNVKSRKKTRGKGRDRRGI